DAHVVAGVTYAYRVGALDGSARASDVVTATPASSSGARSADDRVNVALPAAIASRLRVQVVPSASTPALDPGMRIVGRAYDIDATSLASGASVHVLDQSASL